LRIFPSSSSRLFQFLLSLRWSQVALDLRGLAMRGLCVLVGILLPVLGLVACVDIRRSDTPTPTVNPERRLTAPWLIYQNSTFGLSFRYPPSLTLLLDEPDTSGIQLANGNLRLSIILNPQTPDTVDAYISQLRRSGFREKRRTEISKGAWKGVRLEGTASSRDGFDFEEVVYLVKSKDSLLSAIAIWNKPPPDYPLVEILWSSLQLRLDSFAISPALLTSESFTIFSSPSHKFSFRYPTQWQVFSDSESLVYIVDNRDREAFLFSIVRSNRAGMSLGNAVEGELRTLKAALQNLRTESQYPVSVDGAAGAVRLAGYGRFKDGVPGGFDSLVAISSSDVYVVTAVFKTSNAESLVNKFGEIFRSFAITRR
jgi:hypothetical protein